MYNVLTFSSFAFASIVVVVIFITATSYLQLGIAVVLYPLLVYFAFKLFPRNGSYQKPTTALIRTPIKSIPKTNMANSQKIEISDIDKRTFLKLIGATGISFFLFSILGRRADDLIFNNRNITPNNNQASAEVTEGYKISEVDEGTVSYYGFINKEGGWLIMKEDSANNSYRYAKGDSRFTDNWKGRESIKYDYYYKLFN